MLEPYMPSFHLLMEVERSRRYELLKEAGRCRLVRQARRRESQLLDCILARAGSVLVSAGERLRARYAPAVYHSSEVCCVDR